MDQIQQLLTGLRGLQDLQPLHSVSLAACALLAVVFLVYHSFFASRYPKNLPRLGEEDGQSWSQIRKRFDTDCLEVYNEAYQKYSKKGRTVLVPIFGPHDEVILPPASLQWLCRQPEDVASSLAAQVDSIQLEYSLGNKFAYDPWGGWLVKNEMNRLMENLIGVMSEELPYAFEALWGSDTENWNEFTLFESCRLLTGQLTLRFTVGDSPEGIKLSRSKEFILDCYGILDAMLDTAGAQGAHAKFLRPIISRWASRNMPKKIDALKKKFEPVYRERLQMIKDEAAGKDVKKPRDLLQVFMEYAIKERPREAYNLDDMTKRICVMNFGTLHQTVITLHNLFLDVLGSNEEHDTIAVLRDEVDRVMGSGDISAMKWDKTKIASMTRFDSVSRETLRLHTFLGRAVQRLIICKNGLVTQDGIHLPKGTMVSILAYQAQTDSDTLTEPYKYDPFRFSRPREAAADPATGKPGLNNLSFVSTSADYLPWSHGKHACPGRFLVEYEFKMFLSYALMNYDLRLPESYGGKRPPNTWFAGFGIPPLEPKVQVKRRKEMF